MLSKFNIMYNRKRSSHVTSLSARDFVSSNPCISCTISLMYSCLFLSTRSSSMQSMTVWSSAILYLLWNSGGLTEPSGSVLYLRRWRSPLETMHTRWMFDPLQCAFDPFPISSHDSQMVPDTATLWRSCICDRLALSDSVPVCNNIIMNKRGISLSSPFP